MIAVTADISKHVKAILDNFQQFDDYKATCYPWTMGLHG